MIFIGPLAQSSGKLPRNPKESCFQLVVRMQRVIKFRKAWWKLKYIYPGTMSPANLTIVISFAFFFFSWGYGISPHQGILVGGLFSQSLEKCCIIHLCVCVCIMCLHNVINWLIWSTAFFFLLNKWSFISLMEFQANHFAYIKSKHLGNPKFIYNCTYDPSLYKGKGPFPAEIYSFVLQERDVTVKGSTRAFLLLFSLVSLFYFSLLIKNSVFCHVNFAKNIFRKCIESGP